MADEVSIVFSADISDLQRGLQTATESVAEAGTAMRTSAQQIGASFADLSKAYAAGIAQRAEIVKAASADELAAARAGDRAETDILLDQIKTKELQVKSEAQLSQMSHADEMAALFTLEADREAIEQRHLAFLQATYKDKAAAFANVQRQIDELSAQSALKREQIEETYAKQVYNDYRTTYEQIASTVSGQITDLISGHETLRQAVANVLLAMIRDFIAARLRIVADWAAGVVAQTSLTQAGQVAETSAVMAGTSARTSATQAGAAASAAASIVTIAKTIIASAAETFAGIFGFLAPLMGPAAAGPAGAGQATVLAVGSALPSFDTGSWNLPSDMIAQVHRGEMIIPAAAAAQIRAGGGQAAASTFHTHFNVTAMDSMDVKRFFSANSRVIVQALNDAVRNGSHLGLSKLGRVG
jgi:hypothetical protein